MTRERHLLQPREVVVPLFRGRRGKGVGVSERAPAESAPQRRPARVAHMLALARQIETMIERGELRDRAHAAANLGFTRARVTQLLALTLLAPDIQEDILFLEVHDGVERITDRALRDIVKVDNWEEQRLRWQRLLRRAP